MPPKQKAPKFLPKHDCFVFLQTWLSHESQKEGDNFSPVLYVEVDELFKLMTGRGTFDDVLRMCAVHIEGIKDPLLKDEVDVVFQAMLSKLPAG